MTAKTFDKIGVVLSVGCLVHCLLLPLILPLLPLLGFLFKHDGTFHLILGAGIACVALVALVPGALQHHRLLPITLGMYGIVFIAAGGIAELSGREIVWRGIVVTCIGSCCLILAHYLNHKYRCHLGRHCDCEE